MLVTETPQRASLLLLRLTLSQVCMLGEKVRCDHHPVPGQVVLQERPLVKGPKQSSHLGRVKIINVLTVTSCCSVCAVLQSAAGAGGLPQVSQEVTSVSVDMSGQVRPPSLSALPGGWRPPPGRVRGSAGQQSDLQAHQQGGGHQDLSHSDHPTSSIIR